MEITLKLENFQGPLSLLYHLIEKNKVDIYDIPIAEVTDQYLAIIEAAENKNMDIMSEFLVMAATLLEIKSRMLLPKTKNDIQDEIDPREELVKKLIEYKKFKNVTEKLKEYEEKAAYVVYKEPDVSIDIFKEEDIIEIEQYLKDVTFEDIYRAFQDVLSRKEKKIDRVRSSFKSVSKDLYTVEEKAAYIKDLLALSPKINFKSIFKINARKIEIVVTFIALLELIKVREVKVIQGSSFDEIFIIKGNDGCDNVETK